MKLKIKKLDWDHYPDENMWYSNNDDPDNNGMGLYYIERKQQDIKNHVIYDFYLSIAGFKVDYWFQSLSDAIEYAQKEYENRVQFAVDRVEVAV